MNNYEGHSLDLACSCQMTAEIGISLKKIFFSFFFFLVHKIWEKNRSLIQQYTLLVLRIHRLFRHNSCIPSNVSYNAEKKEYRLCRVV